MRSPPHAAYIVGMSKTWDDGEHPRGQGARFTDKINSSPELGLGGTSVLRETQRRLRGHDFYPRNVAGWPALGTTEEIPIAEHPFAAHYFVAGSDWYICELDTATGEAFGFADMGFGGGEFGYIDMPALETLRVSPHGFPQIIERDLDFKPGTRAKDVLDQYREVPA